MMSSRNHKSSRNTQTHTHTAFNTLGILPEMVMVGDSVLVGVGARATYHAYIRCMYTP